MPLARSKVITHFQAYKSPNYSENGYSKVFTFEIYYDLNINNT